MHDLIETDNGNGVLRCSLAAEVEGGDVDVGLAQDGAEGADETGFVEVVDEEHHGMEVGFQGHALDFDDPGVAHVDHAGEGALALAGEDYWPSSDCSRCELVFNVVMRPSGLFQQPVKVRINGFRLNLFRHQVERIG